MYGSVCRWLCDWNKGNWDAIAIYYGDGNYTCDVCINTYRAKGAVFSILAWFTAQPEYKVYRERYKAIMKVGGQPLELPCRRVECLLS